MLSGGDDYELVFTAPRGAARGARSARARAAARAHAHRHDPRRDARLAVLDAHGKPMAHRGGFDHFGGDDRRSARAGLRVLASGARHRARLRRRAGAASRRAPSARCSAGRSAGCWAALHPAVVFARRGAVLRPRRVGLRGHRARPRRRRPRRDGVGRVRRVPADARVRAARAGLAGGRRSSPSASSTSPSRRRSATSSGATAAASA